MLSKEELLEKYEILKAEMQRRKLKTGSDTPLDVALFKRAMLGIDVPNLGDVVVVPDYISIGGGFVKSPRDAKDVDLIIRQDEDGRDEGTELKLSRLIQKQISKDCHFVYSKAGPHSDFIPMFDLILRAKDETKRVKVKEDYGKADDIEKGIRPAFGSPGGKRYLAKTIVSYIPEHKTYVEPFVGGGAVFFAKEPSEVEVINDLDEEIYKCYSFLQKATEKDLEKLRNMDWNPSKLKHTKLKESKSQTPLEAIYKRIYLINFSFNRYPDGSYRDAEFSPESLIKRIPKLKERLKNAQIYKNDAIEIIKRFSSLNTFFYLDPPYPGDWAQSFGLGHAFDLKTLEKALEKVKGKFILSLNNIKENRELFNKYNIKKVAYPRSSTQGPGGGRSEDTELLISNFPLKKQNIYLAKGDKEYFEGLDQWDNKFIADYAAMSKEVKGNSILSLGCGTGRVEKALLNSGYKVKGLDINDTALAMAKKKGLEVKKADLEREDITESADTVIGLHILEHLDNPKDVVAKAMKAAKKRVVFIAPLGGRLDVTHKQEFKSLDEFKKLFKDADIKKVPNGDNTAIAVINVTKIKKVALKPFGAFTPPKPTMSGLTEAFSVEQIWNWAKDRFPLDVEEKLNGFRCLAEKSGDKIRIKTEGDKDRTKQLEDLVNILKKVPGDFILDFSLGIDRDKQPLPRIKLMILMADKPELQENDVIKATCFDLPYWKDDIHEKPLSERRKKLEEFYNKYLKASPHFALTNFIKVNSREELETQFKRLAKLPQSEGILIKDLNSKWNTDGSAEGWAKLKVEAEIKVIAIKRFPVKTGGYNYQCGLLPGDSDFKNLVEFQGKEYIDLGKCFNTKIKAEPGNILTMGVEEVIPQDDRLDWLGARVIDIDEDRKEPYFANQVIGIAERANILQKREEGGINYKVGDIGKGILQLHIMGIEEEKIEALKKVSAEAVRSRTNPARLKMLLKGAIGEQGAHVDLRMVKKGDDHFEGGEIMIGNLSGLDKLKKLEEGGKLRFGWKVPRKEEPEAEVIEGPISWMKIEKVGKTKIDIFEPGTVGATANKYGAMLILDEFNWEAIEPQDKHAKKFTFKGNKLIPEGTYLMAYVPVAEDERVWMISKLKEEVEKMDFQFKKIDKKEHVVGGIIYEPDKEDTQGDEASAKEIWKALKNYMIKKKSIKVMHKGKVKTVPIIECFQTEEDTHKGGTGPEYLVKKGAWWLSVYLGNEPEIWEDVLAGKLNGFSMAGRASAST